MLFLSSWDKTQEDLDEEYWGGYVRLEEIRPVDLLGSYSRWSIERFHLRVWIGSLYMFACSIYVAQDINGACQTYKD